jgi:septum formation protein
MNNMDKNMKNIILASQSPRRKELLEKCGVEFTCIPADIDESLEKDISLTKAVKELSYLKAKTILEKHPDSIVIGSDTIVALQGVVLGKPKTKEKAFEMLKRLQGNTHEVITGIVIISNQRKFKDVSVSKVTFTSMSDEEINEYIETGECFDKAGGYGIQGFGGRYISHIEGDFYSIMGLPLNIVYKELKNIGLY